jgi:CBS-domain-containing membrane protein
VVSACFEEDDVLVQELMSAEVVTVRPGTSITEAAKVLLDADITAAPVVDAGGGVVGIVSRRDLLADRGVDDPRAHLRAAQLDPTDPPHVVADVMSRAVTTLESGDDDARATHVMLEHGFASVPVVDRGRLIGMVSVTDILRAHTHSDSEIAAALRQRFFDYGESQPIATAVVVDGVVTISDPSDPLAARIAEAVAATTEGVVRVHPTSAPVPVTEASR